MYDIIIIGAGPAGMTAAIYARRAAKTVLVLEALSYGGQIRASTLQRAFTIRRKSSVRSSSLRRLSKSLTGERTS